MVHAHGDGFDAAPGDPLTQRTFPLFFEVLRVLLTGGVTVVAEAAFQDRLWREGLEPLEDLAELRIVQCRVDVAVARERTADRGAQPGRLAAHGDSLARLGPERWEQGFASFERLSIAAPSLDVDTTDGYMPDLAEVVAFVNRP
jgi:predicted kinase